MDSKGFYKIQTEDRSGQLKLSANENLAYPKDIIGKHLTEISKNIDLRIYPEPYGKSFREKVATIKGISADEVLVANGSDSIIDTIVRTTIDSTSTAIIIEPTFTMYEHAIKIRGGKLKRLQLSAGANFCLNPDIILPEISDNDDKLLFLCSPNNPTGNQFRKENVLKIINEFKGIVALDEAYADFGRYSLTSELRNYPNVVIIKTFSKTYGLAGIRIGYCLGSKEIISKMSKILNPYNVNAIALELAVRLLDEKSSYQKMIQTIRFERRRLYEVLLNKENYHPYKSDANFLMFKTLSENINQVIKKINENNIQVRNLSLFPQCQNSLRVTISTKENNDQFLKALE